MRKNIILLIFLLMVSIISIPCFGQKKSETLIIFHIDLNSVSLREDYIRKWLKNAADMGYNAVLWEVENEIQWKTCPECVSPDAFSKKQFQDILNYSRELGLQPIPLLQTIGHAEYVLQHKKYFPLREDPDRYDCYCTSNPDVRKFLKKWIAEYLDIFGDIKYFHLGGDEAYAFASCPVCSVKAAECGANTLYAEHILDIAQPILAKGIRPGIWCDMIMQEPDNIVALPKEFVFWDWNYWDGDETPDRVMVWGQGLRSKDQITDEIKKSFPEIVDDDGNLQAFYTTNVLKRLGYDVILCSGARTYGDGVFAGENNHHVPNIIGAAKKTVETEILGTCVTSWAIRIPNFETQQAWFYLAPLTLQHPDFSHNELLIQTSQDIFGVKNEDFFSAITLIGQSFPFANNKTTGIQWTNLKDSHPAPPGFLKELIVKWKSSENETTWKNNLNVIINVPVKIQDGINQLNKFIPLAKGEFETLSAWSKAAYFQYWSAFIANEIVNRADGKSERSPEEMVELLQSLRREYKSWAETWMTSASAEQNTGLIYDAIINYFQNCYNE